MILKCVAIDDEPLALNVIADYIDKIPNVELQGRFTNSLEAIQFIDGNEVDLIFIDIEMPDMSGFDLIGKLKKKPLIIFTTAFSEYAVEGFKIDAIDYLLKPIDYPDFLKSVKKATEYLSLKNEKNTLVQSNKDFLFIKSEYKVIRVNFDDIIYIQGMSEYVKIHRVNSRPIMTLLSMKSLEAQLPAAKFMRVHKSYIVNLFKVNMIERNEIVYEDGTLIPISQQYKANFQRFVDENFMM